MSISTLNPAEPADSAFVGDGAAQIREVKAALQEAFPAVDGEITKPESYGTASTTKPTAADFSQLFTDITAIVNPSEESIFTKGMMMAWSGIAADVPTGWRLCEGGSDVNGVRIPDLRDRFVVGSGDTYSTNATGDGGITGVTNSYTSGPLANDAGKQSKTTTPASAIAAHVLTEDDIPVHQHGMFANGTPTGDASGGGPLASDSSPGGHSERDYVIAGTSATNRNIGLTGPAGAGQPIGHSGDLDIDHVHSLDLNVSGSLVPKYYALSWIIFTGEPA